MPVTRHPFLPDAIHTGTTVIDQQTVARLASCLEVIRVHGSRIASDFYGRLFREYPAVRAMFPTDMAAQEVKLIRTLQLIVEHAREPSQTMPMLRDLGRKHAEYGAKPEHYQVVCALLLDAVGAHAGDAWTSEVGREWALTLELVSRVMIQAAAEAK